MERNALHLPAALATLLSFCALPHAAAAGNGVPIVDIAAPNANGLSHNRFQDFNVGREGLILNNSPGGAHTQLGGAIAGNPNLVGGAARKILGEVTGGSPSQLRGAIEIAGPGAHFILANPHGITCNGCGFINMPRATLSTGRPLVEGGRLQGYDVDGGHIGIEGAGLDARQVERFELITRSATLNAALHAQHLSVVAGRNRVDGESLAASAKAADGSQAPGLAIDSSALGGMYANAIRLVGTERGVGVRLAGEMAASAGDIHIDANGRLELARAQSAGGVRLKAGDIELGGPLAAAGKVDIEAAGDLRNRGSLDAGGGLSIRLGGGLDNRGGQLRGQDLDFTLGGALYNTQGLIESRGRLGLAAASLSNGQGRINVRGWEGSTDIRIAGLLDNRNGRLDSNARDLDLRSGGLLNDGGWVWHGGSGRFGIDLEQLGLAGGRFVTRSVLHIKRDRWVNRSSLQARELILDVGELEQGAGGRLHGTLALRGQGDNWRNAGQMTSEGRFELDLRGMYSGGGRLMSDESFRMSADSIDLHAGGSIIGGAYLTLDVRKRVVNRGSILTYGDLWLNAEGLANHGVVGSGEALYLNVGSLTGEGEIFSDGDVESHIPLRTLL
ncbi:filamentous hemagglutinin N-terminal domain-containing protein [Pseudomonas citronellolis]|uniref:filamentous hemagglutinin N-terminal domain-containing protein n=1 Tax=Pseudomonas citronellolis TaxID=53408 RepID=UPI0023E44811|nr:filamentous hemagglutinin N-terminal domain-containing protein [Pseudomonas citronellolis]MDF3934810.1 filamentous hemagglutinin N-terminal domain-containing protein [Pseudomonas citronellolis]